MVIPAGVRERSGLNEGIKLVLLETDNGLVLLTRDQLRARVVDQLAGTDLVDNLLTERRRSADIEDAGSGSASRTRTP
jgi:bifunctional DNA-binding transcriptional regulator/antitoxin component of YhaV-PrlF toxin-antitoxin module